MAASAHHLSPLELTDPAALPSHGLSGFVIEQALEVVAGNNLLLGSRPPHKHILHESTDLSDIHVERKPHQNGLL